MLLGLSFLLGLLGEWDTNLGIFGSHFATTRTGLPKNGANTEENRVKIWRG